VPLTQLICDEADRIVKLVERMEAFGEDRPVTKAPVNIHEVLEHCRRLAQNGFGRHVRFSEFYDPSLPPVIGNRDMLVQIFINVIKNACEASGRDDAEIELATAYRHGMRVAVAGTRERVHLPLQVTVRDNGPGIPAELHRHLFDAFVTTKINGSGLGLAFVAKAVADHGGVVRVETGGEGTTFRFSLPIAQVERDSPATNGSRAAAH
jgi:two-component system nitrogen regulation sensor histidine kinase GlnL